MMSFIEKVIGFYHFASDRVPKNVPLVEPKPRIVNPLSRIAFRNCSSITVFPATQHDTRLQYVVN